MFKLSTHQLDKVHIKVKKRIEQNKKYIYLIKYLAKFKINVDKVAKRIYS